ncbi:hypothetical protein JIN77_02370 [Verrucomicrobiaceae bacterium R5-34]|nr:hypothetical protein [Verrucomicrobiaceae bacterium R5-34]
MSQQDGNKDQPSPINEGSPNSGSSTSSGADEGKKVTRLIAKKVEVFADESAEPKAIRPEPRQLSPAKVEAVHEPSEEETEEVTRLEAADRAAAQKAKQSAQKPPKLAKFEKREEATSEELKQEVQWEENRPVGWWIAIAGGMLLVVVIGAVMLSNYLRSSELDDVDVPVVEVASTESAYAGTPQEWFRNRAGTLVDEASDVLRAYGEAENDREKSAWVRNPDRFLERVATWPRSIQPRPGTHDKSKPEIKDTDSTGYLVLQTEDQDYMPMSVYFVRDGEQLKIDWEASAAWSEMTFESMRQKQQAREDLRKSTSSVSTVSSVDPEEAPAFPGDILIRCLIQRRNEFYAGPYNDEEHSAFMLASPDLGQSFWGYVDRDSALDLELRRLLDHGSFVVSLKKNVRVTLRVRSGQKDALPSQLEVVELVFPDWVAP